MAFTKPVDLFHQHGGIVNGLFASLHLPTVDWMNTGAALGILVGSYIWVNLGYSIVLWIAGLSSIPKSLYEAAAVDSACGFQSFLHITLPNLKPIMATITILSILNSFKSFREAYLLTIQVSGASPGSQIINNVEYINCLPLKALHQADGKAYAYLVSDKETALGEEVVAEQLEFQIEDHNDEYAAINTGIASNQTVIANESKLVADGDRIHVEASE